MKKIWKLEHDRKFKTLTYLDEVIGYKKIKSIIKGKPQSLLSTWDALEVEFLFEVDDFIPRPTREDSDFPGLMLILAGNKKAINVLKPLIKEQVEFLPLKTDEGEYWLVNILNVLDCFDEDKIVYRTTDIGLKRIEKFAFRGDCMENQHIFKFAINNYSKVYVSDEFKQLVQKHELKGLKFEALE